MKSPDAFIDTSVLLYLLSADRERADRVESILLEGGAISVQVLNEFASVAMRKLGLSTGEVREILAAVRTTCRVEPLTTATHDAALELLERYGFSLYDSLVVSAALISGCSRLYAEDLQHGQVINRRLRVVNPFRGR